MIKTLRITGIVVTVLGVVLFVFSAFFGFRSDAQIEEFLNAPSVIDKWKQEQGKKAKQGRKQESELVKQAGLFGRYINPPAPAPVRQTAAQPAEVPKVEVQRPATKPKFTVLATVFNESDPQLSVAWIDAPGSGRFWIRQSAEINHLTIEQIRDGVVVAKGSAGTFELPVQLPQEKSYVIGPESESGESVPTAAPPSSRDVSQPGAATTGTGGTVKAQVPQTPAPRTEEQQAALDKIMAELQVRGTGRGDKIDKGDDNRDPEAEQQALAERIFAELEALAQRSTGQEGAGSDKIELGETVEQDAEVETDRVTEPEVEKLGELGEQLGQDQTGPDPADAQSSKRDQWRERRAQMLKERAKRARALAERKKAEQK